MGIFSWMIIGIIAGWMAGVAVGRRGYGLFTSILVGVFGGLAGGLLGGVALKIFDPLSPFNLSTAILALLGSILAVIVHHFVLRPEEPAR